MTEDYRKSLEKIIAEFEGADLRNGNVERHKISCADFILDLKKKGIKRSEIQIDVDDYLENLKPQSEDDECGVDVDYIDNLQTKLWNFIEWVYQFDDIDDVAEVI